MTVDGALIADYAYDANSNRIGVAQAGVGMPTQGCAANLANLSASVDAQDRLLSYGSCNYDYTDNGELTRKTNGATAAVTTYQYDTFSNLRQVTLPDGRTIDYQIDGRSERWTKHWKAERQAMSAR
ncbi:MAG: RHS repeat domain-containing protein [Porticoccaceae bacterium]